MEKRILLLISILIILISCSEDNTTESTNSAPSIQSVSATPPAISMNETTTVSCVATDTDGDNLSYIWSANGGTFPSGATSLSVTWKAPMTNGNYEVEVTVSDGKDTDSYVLVIEIANTPPNQPSNPSPGDGATDVSISTSLNWNCTDPDGDNLIYDVYFGTYSSPDCGVLVSTNQIGTTYAPSSLSENTTYYWKIVATDGAGGETESAIWSFTTESVPCGSIITYSGKTYNTVQIGDQCWFKKNLDVGTMIESNTGSYLQTDNSIIEKYCHNNDASNCATYGGLYEWNEAMQYVITEGTQGICPDGWHIPTKEEYETLQTHVGNQATKLIDENAKSGYTYTNETGFSALFAGYRDRTNGGFYTININTDFWSSTQSVINTAHYMYLNFNGSNVFFNNASKYAGFSVRCMKESKVIDN